MIPYSNSNKYQTKSEAKNEYIVINQNIDMKEAIETHNEDITNLQNQINAKENISSHNSDISNLQTQIDDKVSLEQRQTDMTNINNALNLKVSAATFAETMTTVNNNINSKESITAHNNDVTQIWNSIDKLYDGMYKYVIHSNRYIGVILNYSLGGILYFGESGHRAVLNNVDGDYTLNSNITALTLPTIIKSPNGQTVTDNLIYAFEAPTSNRQTLLSLNTVTVPGGVYKIDFILNAVPVLQCLNLFEGLKKLSLKCDLSLNHNNQFGILRIPSSVDECELEFFKVGDLIIEGNGTLKLLMNAVEVQNVFECKRQLSSDSYIKNTYQTQRLLPLCLKVSHSCLGKVASGMINSYSTIYLYYPHNNSDITLPNEISVSVIHNFTTTRSTTYQSRNLRATNWIE